MVQKQRSYQLCLLEHFYQGCLHANLKICWNDFITNTEALKSVYVFNNERLLQKTQLYWINQFIKNRKPSTSNDVLFYKLATGQHNRRISYKRYRDSIKCVSISCSINPHKWIMESIDQSAWCIKISPADFPQYINP